MASRREDVDLNIVLDDPQCARDYLEHFEWGYGPPDYVVHGIDEKIYLANMSDSEAVLAAHIVLHEWHMKRAMLEKNLARWEH